MDSKQPDELNAVAALEIVRRIAQDPSRVILVSHTMARQRTRQVTRRQIEVCLQKGLIDEGPLLNSQWPLQTLSTPSPGQRIDEHAQQ